MTVNRRTVIGAIGVGTIGLAGCLGGDNGDDDEDIEPGSVEDGFPECSTPDVTELGELFPEPEDLGEDVTGGLAMTMTSPYELEEHGFDSGDHSWRLFVMRTDEPVEETTEIEGQLTAGLDEETPVVAYISQEEYVLYSRGPDEEQARENLATFPDISEECASSAALFEYEG